MFKTDDHYNQGPYRYERDGCLLINYGRLPRKFIFNRESNPTFFFNTQAGHKSHWFIGDNR